MIARAEPGICDKIFLSALPRRSGTFQGQLEDCLKVLAEKAGDASPERPNLLMVTFFIHAEDSGDYFQKKELGLAKIQEFYGSNIPPASFVAQYPEDGREVALDAILLSHPGKGIPRYKNCEGIRYTVVHSPQFTEVYAAGLSAGHKQSDTASQCREAFDILKKILHTEDMDLSHIIRQWNYLEKFLDIQTGHHGARQNYQIFNDIRSAYYAQAEFPNGYPASTGIGMFAGGVVLECIAIKPSSEVFIRPLSNPLQKDAHAYSQEVLVGKASKSLETKAPPLFERAKIITQGSSGIIFVSGTAAVRGQDTVPEEDIRIQTVATIENIKTLISPENLLAAGVDIGASSSPLSQFRAYVKKDRDLPAVKKICEDHFGNVPSQYVISDVCREALLVEIEGAACVPIQGIQNPKGG
jgi:enamine deaminase RidA (YjgF/YER057c/UK114 family)